MPRSGPISLALPPFAGSTRRLILVNLAVFFGFALFGWVAPAPVGLLLGHLALVPAAVLRGEIWQLITYAFLPMGILGTLFTGRLIEETHVGPYRAVVPTLSGTAWITGLAQYVVDPDDPFPNGFTVGDIW